MRFFKLVQQHLGGGENENERISEQDLESPFVEILTKLRRFQRKHHKVPVELYCCWIILYAIAMADYDQDNVELCENVLKTKDGIDRLALYNSSVGRFPNALGAFLYPIYGHGELPQAFCRRAAVKDSPRENRQILGLEDEKWKVARGICITRSSLRPDTSNFLVVYPPRSLYPEQVTSIQALHIGSDLAVCPSGMFVLYFCTLCHDANQGINSLNAAMDSLLTLAKSSHSESSTTVHSENSAEVKPAVLWKALYIQEVTMLSSHRSNLLRPLITTELGCMDCISVVHGEPLPQMVFATDLHSRTFLQLPKSVGVDFRASPLITTELGCTDCILVVHSEPQVQVGSRYFTFDYVYGGSTGLPSSALYDDCVSPLVDALFHGRNATGLAYGEVLMDEVYDLLVPNSPKGVAPLMRARVSIQIRDMRDGGTTLAGVTEAVVRTKEEMAKYLSRGSHSCAIESTDMNSQSR
nr:rab escort protein 1 [Quercus suber]